jgi:hypothetical protein
MFQVTAAKMPPGVDNRCFGTWWAWTEDKKGDFVIGFAPHEGAKHAFPDEWEHVSDVIQTAKQSSTYIEGKIRGLYRITVRSAQTHNPYHASPSANPLLPLHPPALSFALARSLSPRPCAG